MRLEGKVAIITGAASGMGLAAVKLFEQEGAKVVAVDLNAEKMADLASKNVAIIAADVSKETDWQHVVGLAISRFGFINVLVNNAGLSMGPHGIMETTEQEWDRVMNVDLKGPWLGMKAVIPEMIKAGGGSIINTSSTAGLMGGFCDGGSAAYAAAKGGVRLLTKHAANAFGKDNIRVNSVHPGTTITGGSGGNFSEEEIAMFMEALNRETPLALKAAQPIDIAYMYLFLASDESRFATGAEFVVDGGMTSH